VRQRLTLYYNVSVPSSPRSDAGDIGGEEVDAVPVEVAAGAVVVPSGAAADDPVRVRPLAAL
jgi:hypothetical protein